METKKDSYQVEGMTCSGCERTVQRVIGNLEGVKSAKADLNAARVDVEYDPSKVSIDRIRDAVNGVGYKFVGQNPVNRKPGSDEGVA